MNGTYSQERIEVAKAYPGKGWTKKVMGMSDEQVHEIFVSLQFRRDVEARQKKAMAARKEKAEA